MRKLFAIALVALLLGVGIVAIIETDPGYLLMAYGNYTLEASLWVGALLLLLSVLVVFLLLRLVYQVSSGQRRLESNSSSAPEIRTRWRIVTPASGGRSSSSWVQTLSRRAVFSTRSR